MAGEHGELTTTEGIHIPYQWSYADAAARTGATGFTAGHVGKLARQLDNDTLWMLTATTPAWVQVSGNAIAHDTLTGLADDDHTQYLLADGSRAMSGSLDMGTLAITNVGNVDGRDVSADGSKLDGIEAGATADQTPAEILADLLTVDGSGSLLDADKLDNKEATEFLLTTGAQAGATSQAQDFGANGILADNLADSSGGGIAVADDLDMASGADVFPDGSAVGLNARFENLFGDDVPADSYAYTLRQFGTTSGNIAEFEDSQSSPYTFAGGSPFSANVPAGESAESATNRHWLAIRALSANPDLYLEWTSATAESSIFALMAIAPDFTTSDVLCAELRAWAVQSPGANDRWWAIRWTWQPATHPEHPLQVQLWYSAAVGDGLTFGINTGTAVQSHVPFFAGAAYMMQLKCALSGGNSAGTMRQNVADGRYAGGMAAVAGGLPTEIKTARLYVKQQFAYAYVDRMEAI